MKVLGIESSCDETGIAIYDNLTGLLGEELHSQVNMHMTYGGVVPELASRDHIVRILPLVNMVLKQANLNIHDIDGIAYTKGPGLIGALLVGSSIAKAMAYSLRVPVIGIHHMEGHLLAPMMESKAPQFPFLGLLVSGGHTQLIEARSFGNYKLLGDTLDDAAGEAFDKAAIMLGLNYPGGPAIEKIAKNGKVDTFQFPRPMTNRPGLDFSFSGLKTFTLNIIEKNTIGNKINIQTQADIALAFETAVVDTLTIKCKRAIQQTGINRLILAGGVGANISLRKKLFSMASKVGATVYLPSSKYCTDNGAMIAFTGCKRLLSGERDHLDAQPVARWPIDTLSSF